MGELGWSLVMVQIKSLTARSPQQSRFKPGLAINRVRLWELQQNICICWNWLALLRAELISLRNKRKATKPSKQQMMNYSIQMSTFSSDCGCKSFFARLSVAIKQLHMMLHLSDFYHFIFMDAGENIGNFHVQILLTSFPQLLSSADLMSDWFFWQGLNSCPLQEHRKLWVFKWKSAFTEKFEFFRVLTPSWIPWEDGEWWGKRCPLLCKCWGIPITSIHIINLSKDFYSSHYPPCLQDKKLGTIAHCQFMKELFHLPSPKTRFLIK